MFINNTFAHTFKLCLFDLDQTLVESSRAESLRYSLKNDSEAQNKIVVAYNKKLIVPIFSLELLEALRSDFPSLKFGIFTRTYQSYAKAVLNTVYPKFQWDIYVCYEDVEQKKPDPEGINYAMRKLKIANPQEVLMVGDDEYDMCAAIRAGTRRLLITNTWNMRVKTKQNWHALDTYPDYCINNPEDIKYFLSSSSSYLPDLESSLEAEIHSKMFGESNIYCNLPKICDESQSYKFFSASRYYTAKTPLYSSHRASVAIINLKNSIFCKDLFETLFTFIELKGDPFSPIVVTVIPSRQEDLDHRMESFLAEFQNYVGESNSTCDITCKSNLFSFKPDCPSLHKNGNKSKEDRFSIIEDYLVVNDIDFLNQGVMRKFVIVDDVRTSGATLICASRRLIEQGVSEKFILRFSFGTSINGDTYTQQLNTNY